MTTSPATIVPDGVPHDMDRAFLEFPGEADVEAEFFNTPTTDLCFQWAKPGLTMFQLEKPVALAIGDSLSAILLTGQTELRVSPSAARITALDLAATFALETHKFRHEFSGLVEIDKRSPEGTPLFEDGKLACSLTRTGWTYTAFAAPFNVSSRQKILETLRTERIKGPACCWSLGGLLTCGDRSLTFAFLSCR